jgi:hypothetical protein
MFDNSALRKISGSESEETSEVCRILCDVEIHDSYSSAITNIRMSK